MNDVQSFDEDPAVYKTLLESTRAIPWKIDWDTLRYTYVGPQIEELLGWPLDAWQTVDDWRRSIHEDERDKVFNFCVTQSKSGIDHEADYRALTRDGGYVWVRDVVHVVRRPDGTVDSLIGFIFDISDRKKAEEEVMRLQRELEALSFTDGLTGIANRRMFDQRLEAEWRQAQRSGQPLSLVLLDIDHFKQYNDHYGHIQGDACLRRVAEVLRGIARRPRDVVARFGGEEFVCLLPEVNEADAMALARECAEGISRLRIAHASSPTGSTLSASIGVGTAMPGEAGNAGDFVDAVDQALYRAKRAGRNRIESATA